MSRPGAGSRRHGDSRNLLSIADLGPDVAAGIDEVMTLTDSFVEVSERQIPKVPTLRGRTVVSLFFEDSTRTRLSFETAAKRLSADTMNFSVGTSSVKKGESLRDTVETIEAMGVDAIVVRHALVRRAPPGRPVGRRRGHQRRRRLARAPHPGPARLLHDPPARRRRSPASASPSSATSSTRRVARSDVAAFTALGAEVTLVAPPTLLPPSLDGWPVKVSHDIDAVLATTDVCYLLRMQRERMTEALIPSLREYTSLFGLTSRRADLLPDDALIMHPGPMNRGVEIAAEVADRPGAVIIDQVRNGVAVRMAVLFLLLGSGTEWGAAKRRRGG